MIPKIIHHIAPENRNDWSPIWTKCRQSWLDKFSDFTFMLWNDDDIDEFVFNFYPNFWKLYSSFPYHIMKIDFSRFCILQVFGGIYADMDFYCHRNFYDMLEKDIVLVGSMSKKELVQNSLMASSKNHPFFDYVLFELSTKTIYSIKEASMLSSKERINYIKNTTGPNLLSELNLDSVQILDSKLYNPQFNKKSNEAYTRHMHTGIWGREVISRMKKKKISLKEHYEAFRKINLDDFDFYEQ